MPAISNSRPVLGAAIMMRDLDNVEGLDAFIRGRDRDVEIQDLSEEDALVGDWAGFADVAAKSFDGHAGRVGLHGPYNGFNLDAPDKEFRSLIKKRLRDCLEACIKISPAPGSAHMVVHSPFMTWDWYNHDAWPGSKAGQIERVHDSLGEAVKRAEDAGVTIVIENIEDKDPGPWIELVSSFDSPAVRASLDTGHANYAHGATGGPPVDYFVRQAGKLLAHVHVQDTDGFADRHWRIGEGNICWPAVFRALAEECEQPRLILEMNNPRDIVSSAQWLQQQELAE